MLPLALAQELFEFGAQRGVLARPELAAIPAGLQQAIARPLAALARRRGYSADPPGLADLAAPTVSDERSAVLGGGSRPLVAGGSARLPFNWRRASV